MKLLKLFPLLFIGCFLESCNPEDDLPTISGNQRYLDEIFDVAVTSNIRFGEAAQPTFMDPNHIQELYLDVYEPSNDELKERPLIILAFGGGFIFGNKESLDIVTLCNEFAKRGYVCASIDYRLSTNLVLDRNIETSYLAVAKAVHDMRASIRFFNKDAATTNNFKIDPSRIYIGGVSAGAVTALHLVHLDESEIPVEIREYFEQNGGLSGNSGNPGYPEHVAGVINLCGMLLDTDLINPDATTPIVSMHGTEDNIVPYDSGTITILDLGLTVDGSAEIHKKLNEYGVLNDLYTYEGGGHTPFITNTAQMDITVNFIQDFLYQLVR